MLRCMAWGRTAADQLPQCAILLVLRPSACFVLQRTSETRLVRAVQEQYLELTTTVEQDAELYGLGERTSTAGLRLRRDGRPLALWARDCGSMFPDVNLYSSWPYWLEVRPGAGPARAHLSAKECPRTASHLDTAGMPPRPYYSDS